LSTRNRALPNIEFFNGIGPNPASRVALALTSTSARNGAVPVPSSTDALRNTMLLIASPESSRSQRDDRNNDSIQIVRVGGRKV